MVRASSADTAAVSSYFAQYRCCCCGNAQPHMSSEIRKRRQQSIKSTQTEDRQADRQRNERKEGRKSGSKEGNRKDSQTSKSEKRVEFRSQLHCPSDLHSESYSLPSVSVCLTHV